MLVNLLDPVFDVLERFLVGDGIGEDDTDGSFVVSLVDIFVTLLSGSVPNLKFYFTSFNANDFDLKIDSDGGGITDLEIVVAESE